MSKSKGRIPVNCNWQDMTGGQVVYASLPMTLGSKQLHNDYTLKGSTSLALSPSTPLRAPCTLRSRRL